MIIIIFEGELNQSKKSNRVLIDEQKKKVVHIQKFLKLENRNRNFFDGDIKINGNYDDELIEVIRAYVDFIFVDNMSSVNRQGFLQIIDMSELYINDYILDEIICRLAYISSIVHS